LQQYKSAFCKYVNTGEVKSTTIYCEDEENTCKVAPP